MPPLSRLRWCLPALVALAAGVAPAQPPLKPEQAAEMLLNSARKAYNERNLPFARDKFNEYLQKYGGMPQALDARFGLGLTLLEMPERDFAKALEALQPLADKKDFADYPLALYHLGATRRGLGTRELAEGIARPNEMPQRRNNAAGHFAEAAKLFAASAAAFTAKTSAPPADAPLPEGLEWAARAQADQAEMELRLGKTKEALATAAPFADKASPAGRSKSRPLGLYFHGYAALLLGDINTAGRSLTQLAPFDDPVFGTHARYLLARVHHQSNPPELAEAAAQYAAVLDEYTKQKAAAVEALKQPDRFKDNPDEKARLEGLVKGPPPDHVARSAFFAAGMAYEAGRFGEALGKFNDFLKTYPNHPLMPEVQLRIGFCQVKGGQPGEAVKTLQPLTNVAPIADQALLWLGKAQAGVFDANNPAAKDAALKTAAGTIKAAFDKANQMAGAGDADAKVRRAEILLELGDAYIAAKQPKEAAAAYEQLLNEKVLDRRPDLLQRLATARHLAGEYPQSDAVVEQFRKEFPDDPLLREMLFRSAENAWFVALAAEKNPATPRPEVAKLFDEAAKRYQAVVDKFPESERVSLARYGVALCLFRKADFENAQKALEAIPDGDRTGELAPASYLLAECLLRQAPANADDALAAARLQEVLTNASKHLGTFIESNKKAPETPDALLKRGYCNQRIAALLAPGAEKNAAFAAARTDYERLANEFKESPLAAAAIFERAKTLALAGDKGNALNELRRFTNDPLQAAPVAPLAVVQLATLLREQNKAEEGANLLQACRQRHEPTLANDKERAGWVQVLKYHQGVCLLEAGKFADARTLFDQVAQAVPNTPEALEASLRSGQARLTEGQKAVEVARQKLATPGLNPAQQAEANKAVDDALNLVRQAADAFANAAEVYKAALPAADARGRLYYEAAWANRLVAETELARARMALQLEEQKKLQDELNKKTPMGLKPPVAPLPEVPVAKVPLQPGEQKARAAYKALIDGFSDLPLATEARFELSELLCERDETDAAVKLLTEALDKEPPQELTDRIRLRLASCQLAKKDYKAAFAVFDQIAGNAMSPLAPQAVYRAGECLIELKEYAKAAQKLAAFRDNGAYQNIPNLSDRALLRLGDALGKADQWEPARQAYETLLNRFGSSPWTLDARFGMAFALQKQGRFDDAVREYERVTSATGSELGAKAQLQIGLCRQAQKKWPEAATAFLVVPFTYDYPELSGLALMEASACLLESKQSEQAAKLLRRVIDKYPDTKLAEAAKERLGGIKE